MYHKLCFIVWIYDMSYWIRQFKASWSLSMCITGPVRQANGGDDHHTRDEAYNVAAKLTGSICHFTPESRNRQNATSL